jgi:2-iminobutanoate/2-iminopropanoate deaminase
VLGLEPQQEIERGAAMSKQCLISPNAPKPAANFSHAVITNGMIFLAGQGSRDPATGKVVGATMEEQVERTMKNIEGILQTAGSSMDKVVSTIVYITDAANFAALTPAWTKWFPKAPPVRAVIVVSEFGMPGMLVEIIATATT